MAANLILTAEAEQDVADGFDWYEAQRTGLGDTFLEHVGRRITAIRRAPRVHQFWVGNWRRAVVKKFPYIVVYRYDAASHTVTVAAVWHTSRDPDDLLRRLGNDP